MAYRTFVSSLMAISAAVMVASAVPIAAGNDPLVITSAIPTFAAPPQVSTLLIQGTGFGPGGGGTPRPVVSLAGSGGVFHELVVVHASRTAITVKLGANRRGWSARRNRPGRASRSGRSARA